MSWALPREESDIWQVQDGVATRQQLQDSGLSAAYVQAQVDAGRWRAINESVIVSHNGPLTTIQRMWAVWLSSEEP
ncbi:MAG: hypothetical protein JO222_11280, partial [Frankiales bacterium]|nr:hypothetical protein [Frankiales bacterium]